MYLQNNGDVRHFNEFQISLLLPVLWSCYLSADDSLGRCRPRYETSQVCTIQYGLVTNMFLFCQTLQFVICQTGYDTNNTKMLEMFELI